MQIRRLIKCRGRAILAHLNIVAYSLFSRRSGERSGEARSRVTGIRAKEEDARAWVRSQGGTAPKLGRREFLPIPSLMHDSVAVSHFIWVPVRRR